MCDLPLPITTLCCGLQAISIGFDLIGGHGACCRTRLVPPLDVQAQVCQGTVTRTPAFWDWRGGGGIQESALCAVLAQISFGSSPFMA